MLIAVIVYLSIGAFLVFGPARKDLIKVAKDSSFAAKIGLLVVWIIEAPVAVAYGIIKGIKN